VCWVEVGPEDWLRAAELTWTLRDPAVRFIAAIALNRHVPMLTKNAVFHATGCPVKAVW
jgi:PIN domain nuclease of toxin-antitoxin system